MIGLVLALIVMIVGFIGCFIPGLPGSPLILIAAFAHRFYFGEKSASILVLVLLLIIALIALGLEFLASMFGAKKLGATWKGAVGAIVGATVGIFFNLPGLVLGPFVGAFIFEMIGGRKAGESAKAGAGATLGLVLGAVGKLACAAAMIALFTFSAVLNGFGK
jgi:uncharacterized protein